MATLRIVCLFQTRYIIDQTKLCQTKYFRVRDFSNTPLMDWEAVCEGTRTHGFWSTDEKQYHMNYLELLAVFHALRCFTFNRSRHSFKDGSFYSIFLHQSHGFCQVLHTVTAGSWNLVLVRRTRYIPLRLLYCVSLKADFKSRVVSLETE